MPWSQVEGKAGAFIAAFDMICEGRSIVSTSEICMGFAPCNLRVDDITPTLEGRVSNVSHSVPTQTTTVLQMDAVIWIDTSFSVMHTYMSLYAGKPWIKADQV